MKEISSLTVVTSQGVESFSWSANIKIVEATYYIAGDPYPCYHVLDCGDVKKEIRCIHNVVIGYFNEKK